MRSRVPRARKVDNGNQLMVRLMVVAVVLLVALIVALLTTGIFDTQPASLEERNLVLIQKAMEKDPKNASLLLDLAESEYALGRKRDALEHSTQASKLATSTPMVNLRHAQILLLTGDLEGSEQHLLKELALPGNDTEVNARFILAQVYREQGRMDEALETMERALEVEYQSADYRKVYADMLLAADKKDEAIEQYKEVLKYLPDDQHSVDALKELGVTDIPTATADPHSGD